MLTVRLGIRSHPVPRRPKRRRFASSPKPTALFTFGDAESRSRFAGCERLHIRNNKAIGLRSCIVHAEADLCCWVLLEKGREPVGPPAPARPLPIAGRTHADGAHA